jgi:AcrR family transcriptional regulator
VTSPLESDRSAGPAPGRARPLPPDERRAALITATLPLVAHFGTKVTTRQIAEAAGVAEGTIFRVFPDKECLVREAVSTVLDPTPVLAELAEIDITLPLRVRLIQMTTFLQRHLIRIINLMMAVGLHSQPQDIERHRAAVKPSNERINQAVRRLLEPDREKFRYSVEEVAQLLRLLMFSGSHPLINDGKPLTADEIVSVVLDGVCVHHSEGKGTHDLGEGTRC